MDKRSLIILKADVEAQMSLISATMSTLEARVRGLQPDDVVRMESAAYQIHNLYNAVEDLLKFIAAHFENQIADPARWHIQLLRRMTQEIPGVRPALLSQESYLLLNGLRGFRHFFRHAYSVPLEYAQLQINLGKARQLYPCLLHDVAHFMQNLQGESDDAT